MATCTAMQKNTGPLVAKMAAAAAMGLVAATVAAGASTAGGAGDAAAAGATAAASAVVGDGVAVGVAVGVLGLKTFKRSHSPAQIEVIVSVVPRLHCTRNGPLLFSSFVNTSRLMSTCVQRYR